ncbi:hypothetical protein GOPIP_075_00640 [Gordonia polyisoprenivorans NBRC 16320 = JCM 10675]|uniref:Secreted protein n=1 Tax=Gordonia polyisoprenivorans TaxID=84595 RepID=A0A846WRE0_9ACTN|nr:hypothetical protein [Gordonia polyisoprenivorans]NKY02881.1 hypothetical protein [Gordonia polyisoprenivorans]WCB37223.1 hypothetical protein PHA63_24810 [Gordonia polyisoprenivorans]GAB24966.1 hypothetical protein GOPIP_075_00640 [Gordonia polyisoprenivorans NBRC 16320 = JCM 10675]
MTIRTLIRSFAAAGVALGALVLAQPADASASVTAIGFQINPAPYGIPTGSLDSTPARCFAEVGRHRGEVTVTAEEWARWFCPPNSEVRWINLSTGATGVARLSNGLNNIPAHADLRTGPGQVALTLLPGGVYTPGFATVAVP